MRLVLTAASMASGATLASGIALEQQTAVAANPIRKVVTMMQKMGKKLEEEAEAEEQLYEKFECYCKKTQASIEKSIERAQSTTPVSPEDIQKKKNKIKALKDEVKKLKADKLADEESLAASKVNREHEHDVYVHVVDEETETEQAAEGALEALGETPSFLQVGSNSHSGYGVGVGKPWLPKLLRGFDKSKKALDNFVMQKKVSAFLQGKGKPADADTTDVKTFIHEIEDEAHDQIAVEEKEEDVEIVVYVDVKKSKKEEIAALLNLLEKKMRAISALEVEVVNMEHDMENGAESLEDNKKMLAEVQKNCAQKAKDWDERKKYRVEEQVALADTIKMLNSDDALELFKKTIKPAALIQLSAARVEAIQKVRAIVNDLRSKPGKHHPALNFLALKLSGKKVDFSTIFKQIDEMIQLMKTEQADDDSKKTYCDSEFESSADKIKAANEKIEQVSADVDVAAKSIGAVVGEMEALQAGVKELDANIGEAQKNRKAEHAEFEALVAGNTEAIKLLGKAKNRLHKFYKPSLHETTTTTTEDPYATFVQISAYSQREEPAAPPPTFEGGYKANKAGSNAILTMMDTFIKDLEKEITISETEEKNAQEDFVETVEDAKQKRDADMKAAAGKAESKANLEADLQEAKGAKRNTGTELMDVQKYVSDLHAECDWLLANHDLRKKARIEETESMKRTKAVLNGADPNLLA
eukprot:TRINITY_DN899_c0_g1_i3.p1 TRINITY_DN899_c0_g1~~TRINITY_DN899_c0_g1_i3.p1  ORF type:complete len:700 (-),score=269.42 TRINITY_DN899_c0_g1_i3:158-2257(-)